MKVRATRQEVVSIYRKYVDLYLKKGRAGYHVEKADRESYSLMRLIRSPKRKILASGM